MFLRPAATAFAAALLSSPFAAGAAVDAKAVFLENCSTCHGETGKADTDLGARYMAADFTSDEFHKEFTSEAKVKKVIRSGVRDTKMKSWKAILSDAEIDALAKYVLELSKKK
jgi:mono/diheme cytochrome c family protein